MNFYYDIDLPFIALFGLIIAAFTAIAILGIRYECNQKPSDEVRLTQQRYELRYVYLDENQFQRLIEALEKGAAK